MVKPSIESFKNSKPFKQFINRDLTDKETKEFNNFIKVHKYTPDRSMSIIRFITNNLWHWDKRFTIIKNNYSGSLVTQVALYGVEKGKKRYLQINNAKTKHCDFSSEKQRERAECIAKKRRGKKGVTCRSTNYWIKRGFSEGEADIKVKEIQATNTESKYIKKYGKEEGERLFKERNENWINELNSRPNMGYKRSHSLKRYQERYGETEGLKKYKEYRNNNAWGKNASNESKVYFKELLFLLKAKQIDYYFDKNEWFIYDNDRLYFYDLTIPKYKMIFEYHGYAYHPNKNILSENEWEKWHNPFDRNLTADKQYALDKEKETIATKHGWIYKAVYSNNIKETSVELFERLKNGIRGM